MNSIYVACVTTLIYVNAACAQGTSSPAQVDASAQQGGGWRIERTTDRMTDKVRIAASIESQDRIPGLLHDARPTLGLRCMPKNLGSAMELSLVIYTAGAPSRGDLEIRFDKQPPVAMAAEQASSPSWFIVGGDPVWFVEALSRSDSALLRFAHAAGNEQTVGFSLAGKDSAIGAIEHAGCPVTQQQLAIAHASEPGNQPYFEYQVQKQVRQIPGAGNLRYPESLRQDNLEGEVLVQFIVDAFGQYESGSFKVIRSTHPLFTRAVQDALPNMRFYPAELDGKKVRQLVQQPFTFSLRRG